MPTLTVDQLPATVNGSPAHAYGDQAPKSSLNPFRFTDAAFRSRWLGLPAHLPQRSEGAAAQQHLSAYFESRNSRLYQCLGYRTPDEVYFGTDPASLALAAMTLETLKPPGDRQ